MPVPLRLLFLNRRIPCLSKNPSKQVNPKQKRHVQVVNEGTLLMLWAHSISSRHQPSNKHYHVAKNTIKNNDYITFVNYIFHFISFVKLCFYDGHASKLTWPAPLIAATCEKSIPAILILSINMSTAFTHIRVGDVILPSRESFPWTPPSVLYSGSSVSNWTHSLTTTRNFPSITTAFNYERIKIRLDLGLDSSC